MFTASDLPPGLMIDPATGEITGTLDNSASQGGNGGPGIYDVTITATDPQNNTATTTVPYTLTNPAPVVTATIPNQEGTDGFSVSFNVGGNFNDPDGDDLAFSAMGLPTGLTIDPVTGEISGTLDGNASNGGPNGDGIYIVTITADDGEGGTVTTTFTFDASPVPFVPSPPDTSGPDGGDETFEGPDLTGGGLTVAEGVGGDDGIGNNTGLSENEIITNLVESLGSLGGNTALDSDSPISEAIRNMIKTDRAAGLGSALYPRDGLGEFAPKPYIGGQVEAVLERGEGQFSMRTVIWQDHTYVDLKTFGDTEVDNWSVKMRNGDNVPEWISMPDANVILIEKIADVDQVDLIVEAELPDGSIETFPIAVNLDTGEITLRNVPVQTSQTLPDRSIQSVASATPLSDEIQRMASKTMQATRALFSI